MHIWTVSTSVVSAPLGGPLVWHYGVVLLVILSVKFQEEKASESMAHHCLVLACSMLSILSSPVSSGCSADLLAVYKLSIRTFWDEEQFPKQYPEWRPLAQWSNTIGKIRL